MSETEVNVSRKISIISTQIKISDPLPFSVSRLKECAIHKTDTGYNNQPLKGWNHFAVGYIAGSKEITRSHT